MRESYLRLIGPDPLIRNWQRGDQPFRDIIDSFSSLESAVLAAEASHAVRSEELGDLAAAVREWAARGRGAGTSAAATVASIEAMVRSSRTSTDFAEAAARAAFVAGWCARPNSSVAAVRRATEQHPGADSASGSPNR